ncbi:SDR family oxidoreductase [Sphingomicrobium aestuariivivum]|uniref:SDR family oxidoreductase n=1 Tax=Sphingomicrobium aestuariivivum TaxID=1582356 RepID=UPI001FD68045|nr:SDR family oxidoreductase [Sphingomicrobium aestuariivivum]MCJ8189780.1 SDR family oxidoreductase [Sphingomicrobium aestuariivivum]
MNILIAGATGKTGARLTRQLDEAGHHPVAMVRESSDTSVLPHGVETRQADLTDLADDVCEGADVVVFAAGSGGDTSEEMTDKVDRDGAKALIDRAKAKGVSRFVMLSSIGAGDPDPESDLAHYLEAKHAADEHLKASGLDYVIVRPVALTEEDGQRDMTIGDGVDPEGKAHRGDVAAVLARAVDDDLLLNRVVELESR